MWYPNRPYRLVIDRSPDAAPDGFFAWRGRIEDLRRGEVWSCGTSTAVGSTSRGPVVWTESFAECDHPSFRCAVERPVRDRGGRRNRPR